MAKKITKRERKRLRGPNAAVRRSLKQGADYVVAGTAYRGEVSQYANLSAPGMPAQYKKITKGIPFVRA